MVSLETSNYQNYGAGATGKADDWGKLLWVLEMNSTVWDAGTTKFSDTQGSVESRSVPQYYPALAHNALASQVVNTQKAFVTRGTGKKDGAQFIDRFNIAVTGKSGQDPTATNVANQVWAYITPYNWLEDANTAEFLYDVEDSLGNKIGFTNSSIILPVQ